jgi:hypothetical protein
VTIWKFGWEVVQRTTISLISSVKAKDCCMLYNNLALSHAIELLLAGIVVIYATIAWKIGISLPKVVQCTTFTDEQVNVSIHSTWVYLI